MRVFLVVSFCFLFATWLQHCEEEYSQDEITVIPARWDGFVCTCKCFAEERKWKNEESAFGDWHNLCGDSFESADNPVGSRDADR
jgi:hypothetical protein